MAVLVDEETGKICTPGADKDGKAYFQHPMTGVDLIGCEIPMYREAVDLVKKAALHIPELGYIGWDVAITEERPVMIEATTSPGTTSTSFRCTSAPTAWGLSRASTRRSGSSDRTPERRIR